MKKNVLIFCLIIILSLALGFGIRFLTIFIKNKQIEKNYISFIGAIENIDKNFMYILPEDESLKNTYEKLYLPIPETSTRTWKIGDKLEVKYHKDHFQDGYMPVTILKYLGTTRLFRNLANIPVSNSNPVGGVYIFKSLYDYNGTFNKEEFTTINDYSVKKIISYDEYLKYQELIPDIRTLTEDDFVNYYLLIILSSDVSKVYTLESNDETENSLTLSILKHNSISSPTSEKEPLFSGLSVVVPNRCDFDLNNINLKTTSTK